MSGIGNGDDSIGTIGAGADGEIDINSIAWAKSMSDGGAHGDGGAALGEAAAGDFGDQAIISRIGGSISRFDDEGISIGGRDHLVEPIGSTPGSKSEIDWPAWRKTVAGEENGDEIG